MKDPPTYAAPMGSVGPPHDPNLVNVSFSQDMMANILQLLQSQAQHSRAKLDYLKRREEREERESKRRAEMEKARLELEASERELSKETSKVEQKVKLASEVVSNPGLDAAVKQSAADYLKKFFAA